MASRRCYEAANPTDEPAHPAKRNSDEKGMRMNAICTKNGHKVSITKTFNGWYQVGVDGRLVGAFSSVGEALFETAERIRQLTGWQLRTPTLPAAFRRQCKVL